MSRLSADRSLLPVRRRGVRVSVDGEDIVLVDPDGGRHQLNPTAYAIWVLCDGQTATAEMVEAVCTLFGIGRETAAEDVTGALTAFEDAGLVDLDAGEPGP